MKELKEGWKRVKLGELDVVIEDGDRGKNYPSNTDFFMKEYCLFLNNKNIKGDKITEEDSDFITKEKDEVLRKGKLKRNDIVLTTRGSIGNVGYFHSNIKNENIRINSGMVILRNNSENIDTQFIYQLLKSKESKEKFKILSSGTAQPQLPIKDLKKLELFFPPLETQQKIASILSSLDDKIELNNEMNKTLEKMASTLFKRWFIDFEFPNENGEPYRSSGGKMIESELGDIPEGWEVIKVEEVSTITSSKRIFMSDYVEKGIPFFRSKEVIEKSKGKTISTELFITEDKYEEIKTKFGVPQRGDILLTSVGTLGISNLVDDEKFYFKDGNLTWFKDFKILEYSKYLYSWLNFGDGKRQMDMIAIGSTQKALTIAGLKNMKLINPKKDILSEYEEIYKNILEKIEKNTKETYLVTQLRDTLLPKLMSGEVVV